MKNVTRMVEDEVYVAQNELGHEVRIDMRKGELKKTNPRWNYCFRPLGHVAQWTSF